MQTVLKDPESARYRFEEAPAKAYTDAYNRQALRYCYLVYAQINSKNSYGGYTGEHRHAFYIRDGLVLIHRDLTQAAIDFNQYRR